MAQPHAGDSAEPLIPAAEGPGQFGDVPSANMSMTGSECESQLMRSPRGSIRVRFEGSLDASQRKPLTPRSAKALLQQQQQGKGTALKSLAPTTGTILEQLSTLHEMVMQAELAPLVKKSCHLHLFDADRALAKYQLRKEERQGKGQSSNNNTTASRASAASDTPRRATVVAPASSTGSVKPPTRRGSTAQGLAGSAGVNNRSFDSAAAASFTDPNADAMSSPGSDFGGPRRAERRARQERSWKRFLQCVKGQMSPEEVELLSLNTVKQLMKHYGIDRDPVDTANIELHWRTIAQRREDERNKSAIMHKQCAGASDPQKKRAVRAVSASFDKRPAMRR